MLVLYCQVSHPWKPVQRTGRFQLGWQAGPFLTGSNFGVLNYYLFQNTGNGFTDASGLIPNLQPVDLSASAWADYDADGYPDLLYPVKQRKTTLVRASAGYIIISVVLVLRTYPAFSLACRVYHGARLTGATIGNDGRLDLIVTGMSTTNTPTTKVYFIRKMVLCWLISPVLCRSYPIAQWHWRL